MQIIRRDDASINIACQNDDGTPLDITGYAVFFTAKRFITDLDEDAVISKKVTVHTDPTQGLTTIVLTHVDTDLAEDDYVYDFQLVDASGTVSSSERGVLSVSNDVTIRTT